MEAAAYLLDAARCVVHVYAACGHRTQDAANILGMLSSCRNFGRAWEVRVHDGGQDSCCQRPERSEMNLQLCMGTQHGIRHLPGRGQQLIH